MAFSLKGCILPAISPPGSKTEIATVIWVRMYMVQEAHIVAGHVLEFGG